MGNQRGKDPEVGEERNIEDGEGSRSSVMIQPDGLLVGSSSVYVAAGSLVGPNPSLLTHETSPARGM